MSNLVPLMLNGVKVHTRNKMVSLTDMWRAQGSPAHREPYNWERKEGAAFIEAVAITHNLPDNQVIAKKRGKSGATWAHWQIGLAYAKYLSPQFHMQCNVVIRERMEGKTVAPFDHQALARQIAAIVDTKVNRLKQELELNLVAQSAAALLIEQNLMQAPGLTAGDVLDMGGFTLRAGLKGLAAFVSRRLTRWHAQHGTPLRLGRLGRRTAKLFDPIATKEWLAAGGRCAVEDWIKERAGQGRLALPRNGGRP